MSRNFSALLGPGGAGEPSRGFRAPEAINRDAILDNRKEKLLELSHRQVVYILNKINWRLVNILCDLDTDSLSVCIEKINLYFSGLQTRGGGEAFDINLATIMGASAGIGESAKEFLNTFFRNEDGTPMTEAQRLAYFASEWPRGYSDDVEFEPFIAALRAQKKTRDDAIAAKKAGNKSDAARTWGKATLRVGLQPASASELGYIHIFGHSRGESDFINIHCTYEGYTDATGIHFTDNIFNDDVRHQYCNLLGYLLTTNSRELSRKSAEVKRIGQHYKARRTGAIQTYIAPEVLSNFAKDALCSTVPADAIFAYRQLKSTTGIPIPMCGTNTLEAAGPLGIAGPKASGAVGGVSPNAVAVTAAGAGPEAGPMSALSPANIDAGTGPAPASTGMEQYLGANAFVPMSQRVILPSPPGFPPGFPPGPPPGFPPGPPPGFATGPPPGYAPQLPMGLGAATGGTSQQMMYYLPPPRFPVYNPYNSQYIGHYIPGTQPPNSFMNTRYPYYGGKRKTLRRKKSKQKSKQTKHRRRSKQ